jgi:hypothetical protein
MMRYESLRHLDEGDTGKGQIRNTLPVHLAERKRRKAMRHITTKVFFVLAVLTMVGGIVWAASPHYKKGPTVVDNGFTATATGSITGLGNGDVIVTLSFPQATGTTTCTNPGGNTAPGQNPAVPAATSGSVLIEDPKNGNLSFTVTTTPPPNPTPQAAGCPNGQWTAAFDNITFGTGTLTVAQEIPADSGNFQVVLTNTVTLN